MVAAKVRGEPVMVFGTALNIIVIMVATYVLPRFHVHWTTTEIAAAGTISTAVTGVIATFLTKPVHLGSINTLVSTILVASAAFGLHLTSGGIAEVTAAVAAVLGYLMREKVSPAFA